METKAKLLKGSLFTELVNFVKSRKPEALAELEKSYGETLIFDKHRMYPLESYQKISSGALMAVFGTEDDNGYYELGKHAYLQFAKTLIGATLTNLSSPEALVKRAPSIWNTLVNFGERTAVSTDAGAGEAIFSIADDPRNPAYIRGAIEAALNAKKTKLARTEIIDRQANSYTLKINWK